jgi:4-alpha-glucanotransferase
MATVRETNAEAPHLDARASGVLLHLTSLPGPHGSGDLGEEARRFIDFLEAAEQSYWQMLPVGPTGYGNSPYSAQSAFAGNPLLLALQPLVDTGLLAREELADVPAFEAERVDFAAVERFRTQCLRRAYERGKGSRQLAHYCEREREWLADYALFRALKSAHAGVEWTRWEPALRDREPAALARATRELAEPIGFRSFEQFLFAEQWQALREYANAHGVALIGDIPIFLAHDSADVWQHRELFQLDGDGLARVVSGVPPDYFSATGQRWGNPLYDWEKLRQTGYHFWIERMRRTRALFDVVRLDHFIGFERYWEIPADEPTAVKGRWSPGPSDALFEALRDALGETAFIAEDLGEVTPEVKALRDRWNMPGIRILQFAFGGDPSASDFLPHHYVRRTVVFTGTHDNDTTVGWFFGGDSRPSEQVAREQAAVLAYLGRSDAEDIHWAMIRCCLASVADTAIIPMQDLLGLDSSARMNRPGAHAGNWEWRAAAGAASPTLAHKLATLTRTYSRQQRRTPRPTT